MAKPVLSPCYQCLQVYFGIDAHLIDNHFLAIRELQIDSLNIQWEALNYHPKFSFSSFSISCVILKVLSYLFSMQTLTLRLLSIAIWQMEYILVVKISYEIITCKSWNPVINPRASMFLYAICCRSSMAINFSFPISLPLNELKQDQKMHYGNDFLTLYALIYHHRQSK